MTYPWSGTIAHRDTPGTVQEIPPGDVNWMLVGRFGQVIGEDEFIPLPDR